MGVTVDLIGFDELAKALSNADALFVPFASKAMAISVNALEHEIAPYPPQPDRMRSGHLNTYVRGQGSYPKSAFVPDTSEPGGYRIKKTKRGQIKLTSQQMDKKFRQEVKVSKAAVIGTLRNEATYSGYVIGPEEGDPHQVSFHAQTGWTSADEAIEQARPVIEDSLNLAIEAFLKELGGA